MKKEYTYDCDIFHADGTPADSFCSSVRVEENAEDPSMERLAAYTAAYRAAAGDYIHQNATIPGKIEITLVNEGNERCPVEEIRPVAIATLDAIRADLEATEQRHKRDDHHQAHQMPTTITNEGEQLKASALCKIKQACQLLNSAREDMCNLEGDGYCKHYESAGDLFEALGNLSSKFRHLKPPTGVFRW